MSVFRKDLTWGEFAKMRQEFVNKADENTDFRQIYLEDTYVFKRYRPHDPFVKQWCNELREKILDCKEKITLDHELTFEHMSLMHYVTLD